MSPGRKKKVKGKGRGAGMEISRAPRLALPDKMKVVLRYYDYYQTPSLAVNAQGSQLNLNSIFAPVFSGYTVGGQPFGRDQWAAFYGRYIVHRARVSTRFALNDSTFFGDSATCAVGVLNDNLATPSIKAIVEECRSSKLAILSGEGEPCAELATGWIDLATLSGRTKQEYRANDSFYGALVTATPTNNTYHHAYVQDYAGNANTAVMNSLMEQEVEFYDRLLVGPS